MERVGITTFWTGISSNIMVESIKGQTRGGCLLFNQHHGGVYQGPDERRQPAFLVELVGAVLPKTR
jgi:hypothetical protein